MCPGGQELISDEELFLLVVLLCSQNEVSNVVEDCAFVAGGAGELILELYFAELGRVYEEESRETRGCAH